MCVHGGRWHRRIEPTGITYSDGRRRLRAHILRPGTKSLIDDELRVRPSGRTTANILDTVSTVRWLRMAIMKVGRVKLKGLVFLTMWVGWLGYEGHMLWLSVLWRD